MNRAGLNSLSFAGARVGAGLALALSAFALLAGCNNGGFLGYDGVVNRGAVIDPRKTAQLKPGLPAQQALALLGTPSTTSTVGGEAWYYVSQRTERPVAFLNPRVTDQHVFAVYFTKDKKLQRTADYGLQDGKVIDFQTRTMPAAGSDANLVRGMLSAAANLNPF